MKIEIFKEIKDNFAGAKEIIIDDTNIKITFQNTINTHEIQNLQKLLKIDSFLIKNHKIDTMVIIFTYNSKIA